MSGKGVHVCVRVLDATQEMSVTSLGRNVNSIIERIAVDEVGDKQINVSPTKDCLPCKTCADPRRMAAVTVNGVADAEMRVDGR